MTDQDPKPDPTPDPKPPEPKQDPPQISGFTQDQVNAIVAAERKKADEKLADEAKARADAEARLAAETSQREALQKEAAEAEKYGLRMKVGLELGLPAPIVDRLKGETEEDLKRDAEGLKALLKESPGYAGPGRKPPATEPEADMNTLLRRAAGRR